MTDGPTRRAALAGAAATLALAAAGPGRAEAAPLRLRLEGRERQLPRRIHGVNSPANYAIPSEDPDFLPAVRDLAPHYLRFPGGTVANYYNWRTGQLDVAATANPSVYRKFLVEGSVPNSRRMHPKGVSYEDFHFLASAAGADLIFLPNLETSSPRNEAARLADMQGKGLVPRRIEMGNEFYLALLMDPETLRIFPDHAAAMVRTREHLQAMAPYLRKDSLIAVQAAATQLHHPPPRPAHDARSLHEQTWDAALKPEGWFHAVTLHLYPGMSAATSAEDIKDLPGNIETIYPAMLARADEGFERAITFTAEKMPGKEIWVTEWGGFEMQNTFAGAGIKFSGLWLHQIVRGLMAMSRRPEVTVSNYHALFARGDLSSLFRPVPGGYAPVNAAGVLTWFFEASRGPDNYYQRVIVEGAGRIRAEGNIPGESFGDVEAALFRQARKRTLFVHNAWKSARAIDLSNLVAPGTPMRAEVVETPDLLASFQDAAPVPRPLDLASGLTAPAHSLVKVTWTP